MHGFLFVLLLLQPGDDLALADALAERGWTDLARDLYARVEADPALPAERRDDATYGLLRIRMADRDPGKLDGLIADFRKLVDRCRRTEALGDLCDLLQEKGRRLLADDPAAAEREFDAAEKLFQDETDRRPDEERLMFLTYRKAVAMFARAEAYRGFPKFHGVMKRKLAEMIALVADDFLWKYERYLLAYDACIYLGRAWWLLAEHADRAEADKCWSECLTFIGSGKALLGENVEGARDLAVRAYWWETRARIAYGDTKRGAAASHEYRQAARIPEELFRKRPETAKTDLGRAIRLEQIRAWCKGGEAAKGKEPLRRLMEEGTGTRIEDPALDLLDEYFGAEDPALSLASADRHLATGAAFRALVSYRRALGRGTHFSRCWLGIARCYYGLRRDREAAAACGMLAYDRSPWLNDKDGCKAGALRERALARLARGTRDPEDDKAHREYAAWAATQPALAAELGDDASYDAALELEKRKKFLDAAALWERLARKPEGTHREVALFRLGWNHYNAGAAHWDKALQRFADHLAIAGVRSDEAAATRAVRSAYYAARILLDRKQPDRSLEVSAGIEEKHAAADAKWRMTLFALRIEAKVAASRSDEAEADLEMLRQRYEREGVGLDSYLRALSLVAESLRVRSAVKQDKRLMIRYAKLLFTYFQTSREPLDGDRLLAVADVLFAAATESGERELFDKSRTLYEQYLAACEPARAKEIQRKTARAALGAGNAKKAIDYLRIVIGSERVEETTRGSVWEDLADACSAHARSLAVGEERLRYLKEAEHVYHVLSAGRADEHFYRLAAKRAAALWFFDPDRLDAALVEWDKRGYGRRLMCEKCRKEPRSCGHGSPIEIAWDDRPGTAQAGEFCDRIESWRRLVAKRIPNRARPGSSARHAHEQKILSEDELLGGR